MKEVKKDNNADRKRDKKTERLRHKDRKTDT